MDKKYISAAAAAEKWGISPRSVQNFCKNGKIAGAQRFGNSWSIPEDAARPEDGRRKSETGIPKWNFPLLRKTPFLLMSDLYTEAGKADEALGTGSLTTFTMPAHNVVMLGRFAARNDVEYTVGHYTENLDGSWHKEATGNPAGTPPEPHKTKKTENAISVFLFFVELL